MGYFTDQIHKLQAENERLEQGWDNSREVSVQRSKELIQAIDKIEVEKRELKDKYTACKLCHEKLEAENERLEAVIAKNHERWFEKYEKLKAKLKADPDEELRRERFDNKEVENC